MDPDDRQSCAKERAYALRLCQVGCAADVGMPEGAGVALVSWPHTYSLFHATPPSFQNEFDAIVDKEASTKCGGVVDAVGNLMRAGATRLVEENRAQLAHVKGIIDSLKRISTAGGLPEVRYAAGSCAP